MRARRRPFRARAAAARRAASGWPHQRRPMPRARRPTAPRGGRAPSPERQRARARAASTNGLPASGPAPSPSPRPRPRRASDQRRSSGHVADAQRHAIDKGRPRPDPHPAASAHRKGAPHSGHRRSSISPSNPRSSSMGRREQAGQYDTGMRVTVPLRRQSARTRLHRLRGPTVGTVCISPSP